MIIEFKFEDLDSMNVIIIFSEKYGMSQSILFFYEYPRKDFPI